MKTSFGKGRDTIFSKKNADPNKFYKNVEQFKTSINSSNPTIYQSIFNQNMYNNNIKNKAIKTNQKQTKIDKNIISNTIPLDKIMNIPKYNTNIIPKGNFNLQRNLNPTRMKYNNDTKKISYQSSSRSQEKTNNNINSDLQRSAIFQKSINSNTNNKYIENQKKKMGISQMNFYSKNTKNLFPNIQNINSNNLSSLNSNWVIYPQKSFVQQDIYNDYFTSMILMNNQRPYMFNEYIPLFDLDYKRKEEKLKKGQNQLILERLQKKYEAQYKSNNMHRTGVGFYPKNKKANKRQHSAQDNNNIIFNNQESEKNKKEPKSEMLKKNSINNINNINNINLFEKEKIQIDANHSLNSNKNFNKTYVGGFNTKKNNKERKRKEKAIFGKVFKYFKRRTKNNYLWIRYFNRKLKLRLKEQENDTFYTSTNNIYLKKKQKSLDKYNIYPKLIKKIIGKNLIFKKTKKKIIIKKENIKYNTDNSEIDEIKEYKKYQKKFQNKKSEYTHYININNKKEMDLDSSSDSDKSFPSKKEPQFRGLFDQENKTQKKTNINETKDVQGKERNFNFRTTSNFFSKNTFNEKKQEKTNKEKIEEKNKFNIENIINNVIENNKKAAAARSSTSFYNIGSNFMNNRMRSTKTNFYSSKDNKGGGFTGTKDSNFTKEQANEGRYYKSNSLKLTLINPLGWRKHEEIWSNLVSLKLGLSDLEKYLHPPNDTDVLVSSYLKMNPRILNFCSIQKINTSKTNNENNNFISFMIDDNIQNPRQEIKKWKEAYKRAIFRWHPDKLFHNLEEISFKNEQQRVELKKKSTQIINNMNTLYRNIIEILNKIAEAKNDKEEN